MASLPKGSSPLIEHIRQLHSLLHYTTAVDPNAVAVGEHSLMAIAAHTITPDWVLDGMRREVLNEFTTALAMVTAKEPGR